MRVSSLLIIKTQSSTITVSRELVLDIGATSGMDTTALETTPAVELQDMPAIVQGNTVRSITMDNIQDPVLLDELTNQNEEYIFSNGAELNAFMMANLDVVEDMANVICSVYHPTNNSMRIKAGLLALEQLERGVKSEAAYLAKQRLEE